MFQEYPKWVYRTDGPQEKYDEGFEPVLVNNEEQESALIADAAAKTNPGKGKAK